MISSERLKLIENFNPDAPRTYKTVSFFKKRTDYQPQVLTSILYIFATDDIYRRPLIFQTRILLDISCIFLNTFEKIKLYSTVHVIMYRIHIV